MNFSFAGCGFLGIYHVGVAACLKKYAPNLLYNKLSGASAGALAAVCLLCDGPLGIITSSVLKTAFEARRLFMGPFSPTFNVEQLLRDGLFTVLPDDAHIRVSGKLFISVTRVCDGKNVLISQFDTKEELIQALLCSAFIPGFSGWNCPRVKGVRYVDGGFTDNLPQLDENTVTVSPLCGEADISPQDSNAGFLTISLANTSMELSRENLYRFSLILFPPPPEVLNEMCQQGFNDALDFLQRNYMINCTRCLAVHSTINIDEQENIDQGNENFAIHINDTCEDIHCIDCDRNRQEAILDTLPEAVGSILEEAVNNANKGLMNWVFKYRSLKMVSILTLPYVIPMEIIYASYFKLKKSSPSWKDLKAMAQQILQFLKALFRVWFMKPQQMPHSRHSHHHHYEDRRFSCQVAITEFTEDVEVQKINGEIPPKFEFTLDVDDVDGLGERRGSVMESSEALGHLAFRCASRSRRNSCVPSRSVSRNPSRPASRAVSRAVSRRPSVEDVSLEADEIDDYFPPYPSREDAFDQILDVTNQKEALMSYYFTDENNEMKVTEIFDMGSTREDSGRNTLGANLRNFPNRRASLNEMVLRNHLNSFKDEFDNGEVMDDNNSSPYRSEEE